MSKRSRRMAKRDAFKNDLKSIGASLGKNPAAPGPSDTREPTPDSLNAAKLNSHNGKNRLKRQEDPS